MRVYAGQDPLTGRRHYLTETAITPKEAERLRTRLLSQVDEKRSPRSKATVNQLMDRYLDVIELERATRQSYIGKIEKHIRPELGRLQVGRLDAELLESFYALLRRCRDHCHGRKFIQHRTDRPHECDVRCAPHACVPLGPASILVVHSILSGALERAVRWRWIAVNPAARGRGRHSPIGTGGWRVGAGCSRRNDWRAPRCFSWPTGRVVSTVGRSGPSLPRGASESRASSTLSGEVAGGR